MICKLVIYDRRQNLPDSASGEKCLIALELVSMPSHVQQRLSFEATREFQEIFHDEFGEWLSDDEAQRKGVELLNLFAILTQSDGNRAK